MPTYRYAVLVQKDAAGGFTAQPVDTGLTWLAGFGPTANIAIEQLQEYLVWELDRYSWTTEPELEDAKLTIFKVNVRPEYEANGRIYPYEETVPLRVHCVYGTLRSGQKVACLPLLGIRFYFHEDDSTKAPARRDGSRPESLKGLVSRFVHMHMRGMTPAALIRCLPPKEVELTELVINIPRSRTASSDKKPPSTLAQVAEALGEKSVRRQFGRAIERDPELKLLLRKLQREKANVLLVGESGVGKTTLLIDAILSVERQLEEKAKSYDDSWDYPRKFWQTSAGRIIAGMRYLGQWEQRCEAMIADLQQIAGVLCIDRILDLLQIGGTDATDSIAAFMAPYLQRGELRIVGEATPSELNACRRLLPGFTDLFQIVNIEPLNRDQMLHVLDRMLALGKQNQQLEPEPGVSDRIIHLFRRFAPYQVFPGKAVGFTRELLDRCHRLHRSEVTTNDVVAQFRDRTGLPELFLRDEIVLERDAVLNHFRSEVIGQEEAAQAATNIVMTFKAGLNDPKRPLGVLLFCGPTGVGKTEMAQSLGRYFFGGSSDQTRPSSEAPNDSTRSASRSPALLRRVLTPDRFIRLDMSEFSGPDAPERLLGASYGEPSELIRKIRQQPFCILLLDEIEKAAPEVFDMLLGVFDEGKLTDRFGRVTTFRSSIIVMTSNLGADKQSIFGFSPTNKVQSSAYTTEARSWFRPEFFNRLDAIVTFQPLSAETIRAITLRELTAITRREGIASSGLRFEWTDALLDTIIKEGFDPRYGARPLQRTLEKRVVAPLARFLLSHSNLNGATILADVSDNDIKFQERSK